MVSLMPLSPGVTGTQGTDTWQLAWPGSHSGIYPQLQLPSPSLSRSRAHSVQSRVPWGAGEGAAVLLGSGYRTSCPYLPLVQPPEPPPSSCSDLPEEADQLQPQGLYTCSSASEPGLFLRQSCVAQAGLELLADVMTGIPGLCVPRIAGILPTLGQQLCRPRPSPVPWALFMMLRKVPKKLRRKP